VEKLFSYGTLQLESVQVETFGRKLHGTSDILVGYVLSEVRITDKAVIEASGKEVHPILKYTGKNDDRVEGTIFELSSSELAQADEYEVDDYVRLAGDFTSGHVAWIYACAKNNKSIVSV
jgi:hypothetical protein